MKKIILASFILLLVVVLAITGLSFYFYGQFKSLDKEKFIKDKEHEEFKLDIDFKSLSIDYVKLMQFTPALTIRELKIASPSGFKAPYLANIEKVSVELALKPLLMKTIKINSVQIIKPHIILEQNSARKLNIDILMSKIDSKPHAANKPKSEIEKNSQKALDDFLKIQDIKLDELTASKGTFEFMDSYKRQTLATYRFNDVNLKIKNFSLLSPSSISADARVLDSKSQNLSYKGTIGPFTPTSISSRGDLNLDLLISDVPVELRKLYLGNLVLAPREADRVVASANLQGNLLDSINGSGDIDFKKIRLGKNSKRFIFLAGNSPFKITISNLVGIPNIDFSIQNGSLNLDKGTLTFNKRLSIINDRISGSFSGNLKGVEVNRFVSAFSEFEDEVSGIFEIPNVQISYSGEDANQIMNNLNGDGSIVIRDGRARLLDKILKAKDFADSALKLFAGKKTSIPQGEDLGKFTILTTSFKIFDQKFKTPDLNVVSPIAKVYGQGNTKFDQTIKYDLIVDILNQKIPVTIRGTSQDPSIKVDVKSVFEKEVKDELGNLIEKKFGAKINPLNSAETSSETETPAENTQPTESPAPSRSSPQDTINSIKDQIKNKKPKNKEELLNDLLDFGLKQIPR